MNGLDASRFDALTFDCYGTLVDWQSGIRAAVGPLLPEPMEDAELFRRFAASERAHESGPYLPYREVLRRVGRDLLGEAASDERVERFAASVPEWPVFAETASALARLGARFRLCIVSNVDDDMMLGGTLPKLGVEFDEVVTAEQVRSYKPGHAHFHEALRRLGLPRERVLHVAESRYHDVEPANALGIASVWVDRSGGGVSASGPGGGEPDCVVRSLTELADMLGT